MTNYSECDPALGRPLNQPVAVPLWRQSLNLKEGVTRNPMERPGNLIASPRHDKLLHACLTASVIPEIGTACRVHFSAQFGALPDAVRDLAVGG